MNMTALTAAAEELQALEAINEEAIPESERCALADMMATGGEVLCITENGEPAGFMATRSNERLIYLAYLAVRDDLRSRGIGGRALRELIRRYPERQIIVEYESPEESGKNRALRLRRKQFYLRNGFYETGWHTHYDGAEFEIACSSTDFDAEAFKAFAAHLATIVSDHIPNPFQKGTEEKAATEETQPCTS